jgi:hypothetical protein
MLILEREDAGLKTHARSCRQPYPAMPRRCGFASSFPKRRQPLLARFEVVRAQPTAKQFVAKPDAIGVDDVGLAVPRLERVVVVGE